MTRDYDLVLLDGHRDAVPLVGQVLAWGGRVGAILPPLGCPLAEDPRSTLRELPRWQDCPWPEAKQRTEWAIAWDDRLAFWQTLGVDAAVSTARFLGPRRLVAADRLWRSRFYGRVESWPPGLPETWNLVDLWAQTALPPTLAIVGTDALACGLARVLPAWGTQVHLVGRRPYLLRDTDGDRVLQSLLIRSGVHLHLGQPVTAIEPGRLWVGDRPLAVERVLTPTVPHHLTGGETIPCLPAGEPALWQKIVLYGGRSRGQLTVVPGRPPFALWQRHSRADGPRRSHSLPGLTYGRIVTDRRGPWQIEALGEAADTWVAWLGEGPLPPPPRDRLVWENWLALRRTWGF